MKILAIIPLLLLALTGCFFDESPINQALNAGISAEPETATIAACYQYLAAIEEVEKSLYSDMESTDKAFALGMREMRKMAESMSGSKKDQCKPGTNVWDATIAYNNANAETKQMLIREGASALRFGVGVVGTVKAVDAIAGKIGDKINNSGTGAQISTNKEDNDNVAVGNDKSNAEVSNGGSPKDKPLGTCTIAAAHLTDCRTTTNGNATADEYNACLQRDYGYTADEIASCQQ